MAAHTGPCFCLYHVQIVQAAHCGLSILGLALVSNRCKGPLDDYVNPSHEEVLDSVTKASKCVSGFLNSCSLLFPEGLSA